MVVDARHQNYFAFPRPGHLKWLSLTPRLVVNDVFTPRCARVQFEPAFFTASGRFAFKNPNRFSVIANWRQRVEQLELDRFFDREPF